MPAEVFNFETMRKHILGWYYCFFSECWTDTKAENGILLQDVPNAGKRSDVHNSWGRSSNLQDSPLGLEVWVNRYPYDPNFVAVLIQKSPICKVLARVEGQNSTEGAMRALALSIENTLDSRFKAILAKQQKDEFAK
nr:hypothetical protein CFP56_48774 [Quercus suber]